MRPVRQPQTDLRPEPRADRSPDATVAALPYLRNVAQKLSLAVRFLETCRRQRDRDERKLRQWGVPPLFFFHADLQKEWELVRPKPRPFPDADAERLATRDPAGAAAWALAPNLLEETLSFLFESVLIRRAARALPRLVAAASGLQDFLPAARTLADVLAMPEDETILVIHPAARAGVRIVTRGVATVSEFHVLLADRLDGRFPGTRPEGDAVAAASGITSKPDGGPVATARFQMVRPAAILANGILPPGFRGSDFWFWGPEPLAAIPRHQGERTILLGDPVFPLTWEVERWFPRPVERFEIVERLAESSVDAWLTEQCPTYQPQPALARAA